MPQLIAVLMISVFSLTVGCHGLDVPSSQDVVRGFEPIGRWSGHWGIDVQSREGAPVAALGSGVVRFAGTVVHNRTVSIDHGGGIITAYSYLDEVEVAKGERVERGDVVGRSGLHDGTEAFHISVRVDGRYIDPVSLRRCAQAPQRGLFLARRTAAYDSR